MNNSANTIAPEMKTNKLAIVRRIDELPGWLNTQKNSGSEHKQEQTESPVSKWIMPEMPEGYIKAKANNFF